MDSDRDRPRPVGINLRMWRADVAGGCLCMSGTTTGYAVDPLGEYVVGVVVAGAMLARRGRERFVFEPGDVCAWDPSGAHSGRPYACVSWQARLLVIETPSMEGILRESEGSALDIRFAVPRVRDPLLAQRFIELHRALETTPWRLECETLLMEWLLGAGDPSERPESRSAARRDPALRSARELLCDEPAGNVTLDELAVPPVSAGTGCRACSVRRMACRRTAFSSRVESASPAGCSSAASRSPRLRWRPDSSTRATSTATFARRSG